MEKEGTIRSLRVVEEQGLRVGVIVSDRHRYVQIVDFSQSSELLYLCVMLPAS